MLVTSLAFAEMDTHIRIFHEILIAVVRVRGDIVDDRLRILSQFLSIELSSHC
jgi:hypothetical protein